MARRHGRGPRLSVGVRVAAIGASGDERYADRLAQGDAIAGLLGDPEIRVAVEAARVLADLDALAAARDVVAAATASADPPVGVAALRDAVHRLLRDGDDDVDGPALLALLGGDGLAAVFRGADPARAGELAGKLRAALRWRLADGAADPRYAPAVARLDVGTVDALTPARPPRDHIV
ncbi:hypothetical protein OHA72_49690 [Dactylosporangium sp. NBC_01737]|uniref:hypothetical protein n=1 Tax=Dactylosporangium sp. NBC_01737 TaxID=2975959 RepID=UPI002E14B41B|nr:hypothetical protein OHA72_49690 [Dactylosporangium sp. NBC_01737]